MKNITKKVLTVFLSALIVVSSIVVTTLLPATAEGLADNYTFARRTGYDTFATERYNAFYSDNKNILQGRTPYSNRWGGTTFAAMPDTHTPNAKWETLTDGTPASANFTSATGNVYPQIYFELANLTEISHFTFFNKTSRATTEVASFDVYVGNEVSTLWTASNMVIDYDVAQDASNHSEGVVMLEFVFKDGKKPVGKYIGVKLNQVGTIEVSDSNKNLFNRGDTSTPENVYITELAAAGKAVYSITATAGAGGTITPNGTVAANAGENKTFDITAEHSIKKLTVNNSEIPEAVGQKEYSYTFENISANGTIDVQFNIPYEFTSTISYESKFQNEYTNIVNGRTNILQNKAVYAYAGNLDHNYVDRSNTTLWNNGTSDIQWSILTNETFDYNTYGNITAWAYPSLYFDLGEITDIDELLVVNRVGGNNNLYIASFDVFVSNNKDTLWEESNIKASFDRQQPASAVNADFIRLKVYDDQYLKGRFIGIRWNEPYNFKDGSTGVCINKIAAFGTAVDTVTSSASMGGTVSPIGSFETAQTFTFTPDENYKVKDVLVNGESKGAIASYNAAPADKTVEVEFIVDGDIDNDRNLNNNDLSLQKTNLLGTTTSDYSNVNGIADTDICDLVALDAILADFKADDDIQMLATALGKSYFDIQDAVERGDDINNISNVNTARLQNVIKKAQKGEPITVAVIGGSITEGAGASDDAEVANTAEFGNLCYAEHLQKWFADKFYGGDKTKVTLVNAGIGATPSFLGSFRLNSMVLNENPDLCIVEFSVNDFSTISYYDSEIYLGTKAYEAYESIVRRLLENNVAVMQLFMGHPTERGLWNIHRVIGSYYNVPMVSFENALYPNDTAILSNDNRILFADDFHPNNVGHAFMGKVISAYLEKVTVITNKDTTYTPATIPTECVYGDKYCGSNNNILYSGDNQNAVTGGFVYDASADISYKWNGAWVSSAETGTITATVPADVKAVYVIYHPKATGSFETKLGDNATVSTTFKELTRVSWDTVYSGEPLANETQITLTSTGEGLNVVGFAFEYNTTGYK